MLHLRLTISQKVCRDGHTFCISVKYYYLEDEESTRHYVKYISYEYKHEIESISWCFCNVHYCCKYKQNNRFNPLNDRGENIILNAGVIADSPSFKGVFILRHASVNSVYPAFLKITPHIPPPDHRFLLAALTIASTS